MDHDSDDPRVITGLRVAGIDVLSSLEVHHERLSDDEQLEFAASVGRVIYTANRGDFARLHRDWMRAGRAHAGIIARARQVLPIGDQVRGLTGICGEVEPDEAANRFVYLDDWLRG